MCGVTLKTAYNVKQRILAGESIEHKGGAGPKKRLNKGDRISLSLAMKNNPQTSLRTMQSSLKASRGVDVSYSTVRRCIKGMFYSKKTAIKGPNITPSHENVRVICAKKHKFINWNKIFLQMSVPSGFVKDQDQKWETFDPDFIMNFTKSMRKRCDLVIAAATKRLIIE